MIQRMPKLWPYFLATAITFLIGLAVSSHQRNLRNRRSFNGKTLVMTIATGCPAPYYGMGEGDGVYDAYCFNVETRLALAARDGSRGHNSSR